MWWSVGAAVTVYLLIEAATLHMRVPLGHDESVYLLRARAFSAGIDGTDLQYWLPYRAPGLPFLLSLPMRVFGESVTVSRAIVVLLGAGLVIVTSLLVYRLAGPAGGAVAPWLVVLTAAHTSYASLLLLDVPATLCTISAVLLLERSTRNGVVTWFPAALVPIACVVAVYVRFGTASSLVAGLGAVVVARADELFALGRRLRHLVRLAIIGVASALGCAAVLMVPWLTGSALAPLSEQQRRQREKEVSPFASYGDLADLLWPNGSRTGETFTWLSFAVIVVGIGLTLVAARRGVHRRAAIAGLVAVALWLVAVNAALAEMYGNYVALGVPYLVLLAAPGWAWAITRWWPTAAQRSRLLVVAVTVAALAVGSVLSLQAARRQVGYQHRMEVYRATGVLLDDASENERCGVVASYVQVAWYADCQLIVFVTNDEPEDPGRMRTDVQAADFPDRLVVPDEVYAAVFNRGKRQPTGDELDHLLDGGVLVGQVDHPTRSAEIWRLPATDG